jgi:hypothetical protein
MLNLGYLTFEVGAVLGLNAFAEQTSVVTDEEVRRPSEGL